MLLYDVQLYFTAVRGIQGPANTHILPCLIVWQKSAQINFMPNAPDPELQFTKNYLLHPSAVFHPKC